MRSIFALCAVAIAVLPPNASAMPDPLTIDFEPQGTRACAVAAPNADFLVSVCASGLDFSRTNWSSGNSRQVLELLGDDKVTRLCFYKNPKALLGASSDWVAEFRDENPTNLRAVAPLRTIECTLEKWIT